jgi:Domain of unknown function (DUF4340)
MNSKTTGVWFAMAAMLLVFIFIYEHFFHRAAVGPAFLVPGLRAAAVTSVQVYPAGAPEIRVDRTNGDWFLTQPVYYPAQTAAIEALLDALQKLAPPRLTAAELRAQKNYETEFGLEQPQAKLVIAAGGQSWRLEVGNRTAPGDQVYLRVVAVEGVAVADADWLKLIPRTADDWRDTALVPTKPGGYDWIVISNNVKGVAIELRCDPTNHLWSMIRPFPARADADHITGVLQQLQTASVTRFVTDNSNADLAAFGLQPPDLDLWLGRGNNLLTALHVGKSPTNDATQVYARREGWNAVFTTARGALAPWRGAPNDFRDTRLFELTAPVAEIEVRSPTNYFVLQAQGSNTWSISGEKYAADTNAVQSFIQQLGGLRITDFVSDVVTAPELPKYGLATPCRQITLLSRSGDTNAVIAQLDFGAAQTNKIYVKRSDEDSIYAIPLLDFDRLLNAAWEFRDRRIWNFRAADVAQITIHEHGKTRQLVQNAPGKWSLAAGSEGLIESQNIDEAIQMFRQLTVYEWIPNAYTGPDFGFDTNNLQISFELKNGAKRTVDFGGGVPQLHTALATVTLDGQLWAFIFPPALYQLVAAYLTIPANAP